MKPDLDHETTPPPALRARVLRTLHARGLLRPAGRWWPNAVRVAAGLMLFALGGLVGRETAPGTPPAGESGMPRYMLLLYADEEFRWDVPEARLVEEYRDWAVGMRDARFVRGERLDELELMLTSNDAVPGAPVAPLADRAARSRVGLSGYFVIEAANWEEAVALARTCPHLRYGGRIALRPVAPT
jgi:hypothetical protein